jgi:alpha-tubulin suppressor-like RCC1 family protein
LVTAGKMTVALVLENDEIIFSGHNKDSHFDQTVTE